MRTASTLFRPLSILLVLLALVAGCSGDDATQESFEQEVVAARDTADSALASIREPKNTDDLIVRLRAGRDNLATASGAIAIAEAPDDLADERRRLAGALSDMSGEMDAAANSIEIVQGGDSDGETDVRSIVFDTWDKVQAALTALREEGIDVEPLRRHGGAES